MSTTSLAYAARIMVVSPDKAAGADLKKALADSGARVSVASDPQTAAELLYEEQPHFVILAALENVRDTSHWCHEIRREPAGRSPSLLLIATAEHLAEIDFAWGVDDYLSAPWEPAALTARLR